MQCETIAYSIEDCLEALIDYRGRTPRKTDSGIPLITAKIIKDGRIEWPNEFIAADDFDAWMTRGLPQIGDVVMTTEAPLGEVGQIQHLPVALAQRIVTLRGKRDVLHNDYLLYVLQSESVQEQLRSRASGTTVIGIKQSELRKIRLDLPTYERQVEIAAILKSLDDRIDLLRKTSATLEAIAQVLFKSWFIDFDPVRAKAEGREPEGMDAATAALFPTEFEESVLGMIPQGWHTGSLGEICMNPRNQAKPGQMPPNTPYIGLEHMPRRSIALDCHGAVEGLESSKFWFERDDVLFGKLRPYFHKVGLAPCRGVCSTDILVLRPKHSHWLGYLAMQASSEALVSYATQLSNGARMPRTSWQDISGFDVVIPTIQLSKAFSQLLDPIFKRLYLNIESAKALCEIRNTLLPRLVSGKLRLPEAREHLEEALA